MDLSLKPTTNEVEDCEGGDMAACDQLFADTPVGSDAEQGGDGPDGPETADDGLGQVQGAVLAVDVARGGVGRE